MFVHITYLHMLWIGLIRLITSVLLIVLLLVPPALRHLKGVDRRNGSRVTKGKGQWNKNWIPKGEYKHQVSQSVHILLRDPPPLISFLIVHYYYFVSNYTWTGGGQGCGALLIIFMFWSVHNIVFRFNSVSFTEASIEAIHQWWGWAGDPTTSCHVLWIQPLDI